MRFDNKTPHQCWRGPRSQPLRWGPHAGEPFPASSLGKAAMSPGKLGRKGSGSRHSFQTRQPPRPPLPQRETRPRELSGRWAVQETGKKASWSWRRTTEPSYGTIETGRGCGTAKPEGKPRTEAVRQDGSDQEETAWRPSGSGEETKKRQKGCQDGS